MLEKNLLFSSIFCFFAFKFKVMNLFKILSNNAIIYYYNNCMTDFIGAVVGAIYITYNDRKR